MNHDTIKQYITEIVIFFILIIFIFIPELSLAGTDGAEFAVAQTKLVGLISGGLGRVIALTSLAFALIASVLKFNPIAIAGSLGIGLTAGVGTAAVTAGITALI